MEYVTLEAKTREELGKNKVKKLRSEGLIPAIVYGDGNTSIPVSVEAKALAKVYKNELKFNTPIKIVISGGDKPIEENVISYNFEVDALSQKVTHIDFLKLTEGVPIKTTTPIALEGIAPGTKAGGVLIQKLKEITLKCLPKNIPSKILVDISQLQIGDDIKVSDINEAYPDFEFLISHANAIVRIEAPRVKGVDEEIAEAAAAESEEASAAEGDSQGSNESAAE